MSTNQPQNALGATIHASASGTGEDTTAGSVVLVVDQRRDARDALVAALRADGQRVLAASDASSALDLVARDRPDTALVHHALLDGNAIFVRQLRGLAPGLPVIVHGLRSTDAAQRRVLERLDVGITSVDGDDPARLRELAACTAGALRCLRRLRDEHELRGLAIRQLCHTLRAPLEVIQGYTELLRDTPVATEARAVVEGLASAAANARRLTREHLAVAAVDAPGLEVRCEPVELDSLIDELRRLATGPTAGPQLRLLVRRPPSGAILYTDGGKLRMLLAQLLTRASDCAPRGALSLRVSSTSDGTRFEFRERPGGGAGSGALTGGEAVGDPYTGSSAEVALAQRLAALLDAALGTRRGPGSGAIFTLQLPARLRFPPAEMSPRTIH